jgi:hypothetical protein
VRVATALLVVGTTAAQTSDKRTARFKIRVRYGGLTCRSGSAKPRLGYSQDATRLLAKFTICTRHERVTVSAQLPRGAIQVESAAPRKSLHKGFFMWAASIPTHWGERFLASRIDVDENTKKNYRSAVRIIGVTFGDRDPATGTATEIAEWIATLAATRKPGTLGQYLIAFRLLLDHVGLEENVARDPRVKLPKQVREEPTPPSAAHTEAILAALGEK